MRKKTVATLLSLLFLILLAVPAYAAGTTTTTPANTATPANTTAPSSAPSSSTGPFSSLSKSNYGMRPIKPIDLNALGNKAVNFGNQSYNFLLKGSIPLFVWAVGGSVLLVLLGIFLGKRVIAAGVIGILISLGVVVLIHFLPEIVLTVKNGAGNALQ
ncbi:hypothetical protein CEB3_c21050 [Peptococcaceae bacterium CEB3]|nr:hypothetical protein CEB3_c21050 [Peptococcaceae bacterium CEB3]